MLDAAECKRMLVALLVDCTKYIETILIFSCLFETIEFRQVLMMWTMGSDKFMPSVDVIIRQLGPVEAEILGPVLAIARRLEPTTTACTSSAKDDVRGMAAVPAGGRDLQ